MIIIVVAIYKSCTKFHENTTYDPYAAALQSSLLSQYEHEYTGYDTSQFPAPPPPYGFRSISPTESIQQQQQQQSSTSQQTQQSPQQPGFRTEYLATNETNPTATTVPLSRQSNPFNGFWAGAAAGGIAGYMFGRR
jgi:hypothetical protein